MRNRAVVWALGLALIAGLSAGTAAAASKITRVLVVSETTNSVELEVRYSYDGRQGDQVFASAQMTGKGKVLGHYGYRPGRVSRGEGRTLVNLSVNDRAPALFASDGLRVNLYQGGGGAFATANYQFAKTWSKPRTALNPTLAVVGIARPMASGQIAVAPSGGGASGGGTEATASRRIHPDGTVEIRRADGSRVLLRDGSRTVIDANGNEQVYMYSSAQPPTPPNAPPNAQHGAWVEAEAARLLGIIQTLVGYHQPSVDAYMATEGGLSPYGKVSERTGTIGKLVEP